MSSVLQGSDTRAEYRTVRDEVGFVDRSDHGVLEVTGRDRAAFLHAMLSNDIKSLGPRQGRAAAFLDVHGKVQVLLLVWALEDRILVVTPPGMAATTSEALDKYLFSEKAYFRDATGEMALLLVAGPALPDLLRRLSGVAVPGGAWDSVTGQLAGSDVRLVRGGGESGEAEVWVVAPAEAGDRVRKALREGGARPIGPAAWDVLRIEAGWPVYGRDVDGTTLLPEVPIEGWVSYSKGCYIGQEVVVRIRDRGHVNRHLRGLVLEGDQVPAAGAPVVAGPAEVGRVTSAAWSPGLERPVALGYVRRQHAEPGTAVGVRIGDATVPAMVAALPLARSAST
jgi:folate-binding protein YgfZ